MLKWLDILKFANNGNPIPDKKVEKTEQEWKELLSPEEYQVTRCKGTERPYSSEMCNAFEKGRYACVCCDTELFDSEEKFQSGTGWPSFTQPIKANALAYHKDRTYSMYRIETLCNTCNAHLGHVFEDGPPPSGLRYCINALALKKIKTKESKAIFGGGCFWCTEAIFQRLKGVLHVESGYSGGKIKNPTYREVTNGLTGHAEVVQVVYDTTHITYRDLIYIHLTTHNPCTLNRQGADIGSQYRSILFYRSEDEKKQAIEVMNELQSFFTEPIVTELKPFEAFYKAEDYHQNYYTTNTNQPYCQLVIEPKLEKFRKMYTEKLKEY